MTRARELADQHKTLDVDGGTIKLDGNYPTGTGNVALGDTALDDGSLSGAYNTAIGSSALTANTTGASNTAVGRQSMAVNTSGAGNAAFGYRSLYSGTSGNYNTALGNSALNSNTTASNNTAVGHQALYDNTTGQVNTALGGQSAYNVTTGSSNTIIGFQAGYTGTSFQHNCFVGTQAGYFSTGTGNTFIGASTASIGSGGSMTTGSKNTIIGAYNGNQGGLDIRTSSNNIVLSDGDGNPRLFWDSSLSVWKTDTYGASTNGFSGTSGQFIVYTTGTNFYQYNGTSYYLVTTAGGSTSDETLKTNMQNIPNALEKVCALNGFTYEFIEEGLCDSTKGTQIGVGAQTVEAQFPELVSTDQDGIKAVKYDRLVAPLIEAIKELSAKNDELEARITALEAN